MAGQCSSALHTYVGGIHALRLWLFLGKWAACIRAVKPSGGYLYYAYLACDIGFLRWYIPYLTEYYCMDVRILPEVPQMKDAVRMRACVCV